MTKGTGEDMLAKTRYDFLTILAFYRVEGDNIVIVNCPNYDTYEALPDAIEYSGLILGKTGWNSDTCKACYKFPNKLAKKL